ncbi:ABC transporter substrate-binding protein [Streptomyces sp. TR06-5]|uniref:ABC transporter substrate-binding protein n=1 Tax=unclassified Streptomyces TaxID=2593676 RepID=UPI00399F65C7
MSALTRNLRSRSRLRNGLRRTTVVAAVAAVAAPLLSGCGAGPGDGANAPIKVMTWAPQDTGAISMAGMPAMAEAFGRWVNAGGGVDGHRLEVLTCDEHNTAAGATACAERAVDEGVVAVVGSYSRFGRAFIAPLESADIPYIGGFGVTEDEFNSPLSYPVHGGLAALAAGSGRQLAAAGCTDVTLVRPDTLAGDRLPPLLDAGLSDGDGTAAPATDVRAPEDATSYGPQAEKALEGAAPAAATGAGKPCVSAVLGGRTDTFFDSFRRLGSESSEVTWASVLGSIGQHLVDSTGGRNSPLEGTYATGWYPASDDPRWDRMHRVVREHAFGDNRIDTDDSGVRTTWIACTVLRAALERIDGATPVSARSLKHELDNGPAISTRGLTPDLRWHFEDLLAAAEFPRIVNTKVTFQRVRDGRLTQVGDGFVDVRKQLVSGPDV